MEEEKG